MPARNTIREYDVPAYYHVYNRGAGERAIFVDAGDKRKFLSLLERHLSEDDAYDQFPTYDVELLAYCVMGNHYHLLLFQEHDPRAISQLMKSVSTAYSMYFNRKYKSQGHVFQSVFRSSHITNESYLAHISRYIHLNPKEYRTYKWSSLPYYVGEQSPEWVKPGRILDMTPQKYQEFLEEYRDRRQLLKEIKAQLAL